MAAEATSEWVTEWGLVEELVPSVEGWALEWDEDMQATPMLGVGPGMVCPMAILMEGTDLTTHTPAMAWGIPTNDQGPFKIARMIPRQAGSAPHVAFETKKEMYYARI